MKKINRKNIVLDFCSVFILLSSASAAAFDFAAYFECLLNCGGSCTYDGVCYTIEK